MDSLDLEVPALFWPSAITFRARVMWTFSSNLTRARPWCHRFGIAFRVLVLRLRIKPETQLICGHRRPLARCWNSNIRAAASSPIISAEATVMDSEVGISSAELSWGGGGDSASILQQWILANPVLPTLSHALSDSIDELTCPHGIKLFMGGDGISEVRVDGERHEIASAALANMGWPRLSPPGYVRSYLLVLHRETES